MSWAREEVRGGSAGKDSVQDGRTGQMLRFTEPRTPLTPFLTASPVTGNGAPCALDRNNG